MRTTDPGGPRAGAARAGCGSDDERRRRRRREGATLSGPVTYERGGGLKGRRDRLVVQPDGSATLTVQDTPKSMTLTDKELATLARRPRPGRPRRAAPGLDRRDGRCPTRSATA